ncbi:MAG: MaoC/PaaZ C-terminal domain-containing protein [Thermoflexales bacterium]|nr:MaoC/PaaZ C-terminal domain-containing protein [Thermoflexales bacterium]MDW8351111.1 MaoC/PaaZ C-terminal domain-containing protein [Anaerolineae bacterium]
MALTTPHGLYFEDFVVGDRATSPSRTVTEADIVMFAGLSGDYNEIHTSEAFSQGNMFGRRIAHGLLGLSIASGLAFQMGFLLGTVEAFRSIEWEFTAPIFIGDTIHLEAEVVEVKAFPRLGNGKVTFKVSVKKQDGSVAQRGTWTLLVKGKPKVA